MKRLIVCSDGTWQKLASVYPTNVVKMTQAIKPSSDGISQIVFYDEGIGSGTGLGTILSSLHRFLGGAFGIGIDTNIQEAYRFLSLNYEPGDEIYLFGFSRGAYTVRSLAGLIDCSGGLLSLPHVREAPFAYAIYHDSSLTCKEKAAFRRLPIPYKYLSDFAKIKKCRSEALKIYRNRQVFGSVEKANQAELKEARKAQEDLIKKQEKVQKLLQRYGLKEREESDIRQNAEITLLACWDTVGSLGIPKTFPLLSRWINKKYEFHNTNLSSRVQNALHAVAIDEVRQVFDVTPMTRLDGNREHLHEVWFPGGHGAVGGGNHSERGLSDRALQWMMEQIKELKLGLAFDPSMVEDGVQPNHTIDFQVFSGIFGFLGVNHRRLEGSIDASVKKRWQDRLDYRPLNLRKYAQQHGWIRSSTDKPRGNLGPSDWTF